MRYAIEVNLARKGAEPMWQTLVDDNDDTCWWDNEADAYAALVEEERGENARLMRFDAVGARILP